ncbi:DMT family transporter [Aquincola sp. J276]|uniref:DMT family transporter n=1 Tax=Aquincola sp. J276 TaxID=2898432 RepID=UPI0021516DC3|nr:DMT family transporter [Aquincola sp. J276]MCR5866011.1 DMT family transporter [Aquincola sp. J276]
MQAAVRTGTALPVLALTVNAFIWGVSWWPFRQFQALGMHPLWTTAAVYALVLAALTAWQRGVWAGLARTPSPWLLVLASGTTNAAFNWGVTVGDVVRVVLLFYLMPLWALLLARLILGERLTPMAALRMVLALAGAAVVLWPAGGGWPWPRNLPEALGVLGGFTFALNNVWLRREAHRSDAERATAMFLGGTLVSAVVAGSLTWHGAVAVPPLPSAGTALALLALSTAFIGANLGLQYGAARLRANVTAVVMLTEIVFAAVSAAALGAGTLDARLLLGGSLIVAAALLSVWQPGAAGH